MAIYSLIIALVQSVSGPRVKRVDVGAFHALRGYEVHLSVTNTEIAQWPEALFLTLGQVTLLHLDLDDNLLTTLEPFLSRSLPTFSSSCSSAEWPTGDVVS